MRVGIAILLAQLGGCQLLASEGSRARKADAAAGAGGASGTSGGTAGSGGLAGGGASGAGAGAGGTSGPLAVSPMATSLLASAELAYRATGSGSGTVTWSVVEPGGGSVTPDGVYAAPLDEGTYHVRATTPSGSADASVVVRRVLAPVVLASAGTISSASGQSQQSHLAYVPSTGEWWLFYDSSARPTSLLTRHSSDFRTWTDGAELMLPLPSAGDGRNLAVFYRRLGGVDVVHVTQGTLGSARTRYHVKAVVRAGAIEFGRAREVNSGSGDDPDGAATLVTASGHVIDATGWLPTPRTDPLTPCGTGDVVVYEGDLDDGGTTSFDDMLYRQSVLWCVPQTVNARLLLESEGTVYHLFEDGGPGSDPTNVLFVIRPASGGWLPPEPASGPAVRPPAVFAREAPYNVDDWTAIDLGGRIHAVRRLVDGGFEHRRKRAGDAVAWDDGDVIPSDPQRVGSGLFLGRYGTGLVLVAMGQDDTLRYIFWNGRGWGRWISLVAPQGRVRGYLSGAMPEGDARPALLWTQVSGNDFDLVGVQLP